LNVEIRKHIKRTGGSYRVDETYIKVKGQWKYLDRAVDKDNQTIDFLLSPKRDIAAVKKFFQKVLNQPHSTVPYVINTDKNPAYPGAIAKLQAAQKLENSCKLRQIKYLNNVVEQDHRFVKRMCRHKQWFRKFSAARNTIAGFETMHMIKKGQVKRVAKYDIIAQNSFIGSLLQKAA